MWFKPEENLTDQQIKAGLKNIIGDGIASQAMGILTGGVFLTAFAIKLGASNMVIGLLAAIGPLSQLIQLPSVVLIEKIRNRRAIVVVTAALSRICWLLIAMIPFLFGAKLGLGILLATMLAASSLGAVSGCSWNSWMRDLIPQNILGSFFSKRMRLATGVGIALSVIAAVFLDFWKKSYENSELQGYSLHRLAMVKEEGEVEEKVVARELFTEVRSQVRILSSVEGLR